MMEYVLLVERCVLATVFTLAFIGKVRTRSGFGQFVVSIQRLAHLPSSAAAVVAVVITMSEGGTVLLLALPGTTDLGFILAGGLILIFITVVLRGSLSGVTAECRCFGKAAVIGVAMVLRNAILLAVAVSGLLMKPAGKMDDLTYTALALLAGCCGGIAFVRYYDVAVRFVATHMTPLSPTESA